MSTADPSLKLLCNNCGAQNNSEDKFCSGCGQSLFEKCPSCTEPTPIGKNFCSHCGCDLKSAFESQADEQKQNLVRIHELIAKGQLTGALRSATALSELADFRFREIAAEAKSLVEQLESAVEHWKDKIGTMPDQVDQLITQKDYKGAVALLEPIPVAFLSPELKQKLESAQRQLQIAAQAKKSLKAALAEKDYPGALYELNQLIELYPSKQKYQDLLVQVAGKVLKQAQKLAAKGRQTGALETLNVIPVKYQTEAHRDLRSELEELVYLRRVVAASPFASSFVGAAIEKLRKLTPDDKLVGDVANKFSKARRTGPVKGYHRQPTWMKPRGGTFSFTIAPCTLPSNIPGARPQVIEKAGSQFWTAFGLALQGLGRGEDSADLLVKKSKGLLGALGRKKRVGQTAWGIDIGGSSLKAVRLSVSDEAQVILEEAAMLPFESTSEEGRPSRVLEALKKLAQDKSFIENPVVTNTANEDLLARYIELPTDNTSKHIDFIDQEAKANIPIAEDAISRSYYRFEAPNEHAFSQLATLVAIRKSEIESISSLFNQAELNLTAVIAEPFAIFNTLKHLDFLGELDHDSNDAMLILDVGSSRTTVQTVSRYSTWFRTMEWGIDSLNKGIASEMGITKADADKLRRNPSISHSLSQIMSLLRDNCNVPRRELERSLRVAQEQTIELNLESALLIGGGAFQPLLGSLINGEDL